MMKPSKNLEQMLDLLSERGLSFSEPERTRLIRFLLDVNYYRASGYWRYFQIAPHMGDNTFHADATVEKIVEVYEFDHQLRNILLEGLSVVEVSFRSRFAYLFSQALDDYSYLESATFISEIENGQVESGLARKAEQLVDSIRQDLSQSKEPYIVRFLASGMNPPIWVAVEALSMGTVSKMYGLIANEDVRYKVAKSFGYAKPDLIAATFKSLTVLRNICAHHGRVWNRVPAIATPVLDRLKTDADKSIYHRKPWAWIVTLADLVDQISRNKEYSDGLYHFLARYPHLVDGMKYPHGR
jgi:abortive infection bacteriophage resistance protein